MNYWAKELDYPVKWGSWASQDHLSLLFPQLFCRCGQSTSKVQSYWSVDRWSTKSLGKLPAGMSRTGGTLPNCAPVDSGDARGNRVLL